MERRAKIVCTLGPATGDSGSIRELVAAGMDVARLNLSHGSHEEHAERYRLVREASDSVGRAVGVLADLTGPKIRLGDFADGSVAWRLGQQVTITTDKVLGDAGRVSTNYLNLTDDVQVGDLLLVDDGNVALVAREVSGSEVLCEVTVGGTVSNRKGLSLPHTDMSVPAMTDKDWDDLRFALSLRVDMVAMSFVRSAQDATAVREFLDAAAAPVMMIAKIEKPQAVDALPDIVAAFDAIMLARGDLGVETPLERVPLVQRRAVRLAREAGKPVIVATQMFESMITHARPTRAEVSDVATAIVDGADAVMLSAETSVGAYPILAVATMSRVISAAEEDPERRGSSLEATSVTASSVLARAATDVANYTGARVLAAFTQTGASARRLARERPDVPIVAFTPDPLVRSQLSLTWGVETYIVPDVATSEEMVRQVDESLLLSGRADLGDLIVIVSGPPNAGHSRTNLVRVHRVGDPV
jgi:pyruvate kinase